MNLGFCTVRFCVVCCGVVEQAASHHPFKRNLCRRVFLLLGTVWVSKPAGSKPRHLLFFNQKPEGRPNSSELRLGCIKKREQCFPSTQSNPIKGVHQQDWLCRPFIMWLLEGKLNTLTWDPLNLSSYGEDASYSKASNVLKHAIYIFYHLFL